MSVVLLVAEDDVRECDVLWCLLVFESVIRCTDDVECAAPAYRFGVCVCIVEVVSCCVSSFEIRCRISEAVIFPSLGFLENGLSSHPCRSLSVRESDVFVYVKSAQGVVLHDSRRRQSVEGIYDEHGFLCLGVVESHEFFCRKALSSVVHCRHSESVDFVCL